ncbi:hypothetical protein GSI_02775 [Ganoderma sinense ZZ0214-1]|uniref:Uncharacterized protein n=1 Tax=Ganoderma sinense ZZ0214-1 TaxID=1077348 RepID=A0A2G8SN35_9APHY|nr:hypothetical protein GSI_02775 [Ganoderma sinense ZZ0214-1]
MQRPSSPDFRPNAANDDDTNTSTCSATELSTTSYTRAYTTNDLVAVVRHLPPRPISEEERSPGLPVHSSNPDVARMILDDTSSDSPLHIHITPTIRRNNTDIAIIDVAASATTASHPGIDHVRAFWEEVADDVGYNYAFLLSLSIARVLERRARALM